MNIFGREEPEAVTISGQPLRCVVCRNEGFYRRTAQLHTGVATFFNLEWATSPTCTCIVCSMCGYVHWFVPGRVGE